MTGAAIGLFLKKWVLPVLTFAIPIPLVLIAAVLAWAHFDKTSAVRVAVDKAVDGLVYSAKNEALQAQLDKERHDRAAAETALAGLNQALADTDKRNAAQVQMREQERADNEKKLAVAGRRCGLDDSDIQWLRRRKGG